MSLAIAYNMKKKAKKKMACGGEPHGHELHMCHEGCHMWAGGRAEDEDEHNKQYGLNEEKEVSKHPNMHTKRMKEMKGVHPYGGGPRHEKHEKVLKEMKNMKTGYFADGGDVEEDKVAESMKDAFHTPEPRAPKEVEPDKEIVTHETPFTRSMKGAFKAHGGEILKEEASGYLPMPNEHEVHNSLAEHEDERMLNQHGEEEVGARGMYEDNEHHADNVYPHKLTNPQDEGFDGDDDMIASIMHKLGKKMMSKGGEVANDVGDGEDADMKENQFDDLVLDDDLEEHYTGKNSGDEDGDEQEDEDRKDIVSQIMKSRKKKDKLPHPM